MNCFIILAISIFISIPINSNCQNVYIYKNNTKCFPEYNINPYENITAVFDSCSWQYIEKIMYKDLQNIDLIIEIFNADTVDFDCFSSCKLNLLSISIYHSKIIKNPLLINKTVGVLTISNCGFQSLELINHFPNLRYLYLIGFLDLLADMNKKDTLTRHFGKNGFYYSLLIPIYNLKYLHHLGLNGFDDYVYDSKLFASDSISSLYLGGSGKLSLNFDKPENIKGIMIEGFSKTDSTYIEQIRQSCKNLREFTWLK